MASFRILTIFSIAIIAVSFSKKLPDTHKEIIEHKRDEYYGQTQPTTDNPPPSPSTQATAHNPPPPSTQPTEPCKQELTKEDGSRLCQGVLDNKIIEFGCGKKIVCIVPSLEELTHDLEKIGGYNRHYVALTEEEAARNFDDLMPEVSPDPNGQPGLHRGKKIGHFRPGHPLYHKRFKRTLVSIQCLNAGDHININQQSRRLMCGMCQRVTRLSDDIFPRFINEITCDSSVLGFPTTTESCQFSDTVRFGGCHQKSMVIDVLTKRAGNFEQVFSNATVTIFRQVWSKMTQEIRTCCECFV